MGADEGAHPADGEGPVREVYVSRFEIARTTVTNLAFQKFIEATGYQTVAEQVGSSFVFQGLVDQPGNWPVPRNAPWWREVGGANWMVPFGGNSTIENILDHPVTHIAFNDALAYCQWSGTRLPREAE